jgi:DNA-binding CsgD family transcriptional regulator
MRADVLDDPVKVVHQLRVVPESSRTPQARQPVLDDLLLDDDAASVYVYALRNGWVGTSLDAAADLGLTVQTLHEQIERLLAARLLRPEPGNPRRFAALDPELAAASLISPLEAEIHHRRDLITNIRAQMSDLRPQYAQARSRDGSTSSIRTLRDQAEVRGSLHLAATECRSEVLSVRPRNAGWDTTPDETLARDLAALRRGVRVRVLYQHSARADLAVRSFVKRIAAEGADVRTVNNLPKAFVVFDGGIAFTPEARGAVEVSNAAVAQLLCDVFEEIWDSALPYTGVEAGYEGVADEMQKTIAKMLAEGLTDEAIARRLGMSLRTCRRHVATLLRGLNAVSRFQAGARAAHVGIVNDE